MRDPAAAGILNPSPEVDLKRPDPLLIVTPGDHVYLVYLRQEVVLELVA